MEIYNEVLNPLIGDNLPFQVLPESVEKAIEIIKNYRFSFLEKDGETKIEIFEKVRNFVKLTLEKKDTNANKWIEFNHCLRKTIKESDNSPKEKINSIFISPTQKDLQQHLPRDFFSHLTRCEDRLCISWELHSEGDIFDKMIESSKDLLNREHSRVGVFYAHQAYFQNVKTCLNLCNQQQLPDFWEVYFETLPEIKTPYSSFDIFEDLCIKKLMTVGVMTKAIPVLSKLSSNQGTKSGKEADRCKKGIELLEPCLQQHVNLIDFEQIENLIQQVEKLPKEVWEIGFSFLSPITNYPEAYFNHVSNCNESCGFWSLFKKFTEHSEDSVPLPPTTILSAQKALRRIKHIPVKTNAKKYCVPEGNKILAWHISQQQDPSDRENLSLDAIDAMARLISGRSVYGEIEPRKTLSTIKLSIELNDFLNKENLILHFERRIKYMIHLFAFLWEDGGTFRPSNVPLTYGVIKEKILKTHHRCHSAIVASIDRKGAEENASWQLARGGLFLDKKIIHRLNHTVVLPRECNTVDGMVEGKHQNLKGGMRPLIFKQLELLAKKDSPHPLKAIQQFVEELKTHLQILKKKFTEKTLEFNYIDAHLDFLNQLNIECFFKLCLQECNLLSTNDFHNDSIALRKFLREEKMEKK